MNLNKLEILEDEFDLFVALNDKNKIEFLFDAMEDGLESSILKQVDRLSHNIVKRPPIIHTEDFQVGNTRLCITFTKNRVHLNSDSLKAIRRFVCKMINDGLLLWPTKEKKSDMDMYRYFKSYKIIARGTPLSSN